MSKYVNRNKTLLDILSEPAKSVLRLPIVVKKYMTFRQHLIDALTTSSVQWVAGQRSAVGSASGSRTRGPGFETRSVNVLSFLLPLIEEGQLSVTGKIYTRRTV